MRAPGDSQGQARDSQGQALASGQRGGETARQRGGLSRSHGLAHAIRQRGGETAARPGWAVYWKASGPEVVS